MYVGHVVMHVRAACAERLQHTKSRLIYLMIIRCYTCILCLDDGADRLRYTYTIYPSVTHADTCDAPSRLIGSGAGIHLKHYPLLSR